MDSSVVYTDKFWDLWFWMRIYCSLLNPGIWHKRNSVSIFLRMYIRKLEIIWITVNVQPAYVLWYVDKQKRNFKLNRNLGFHVGVDPVQVIVKISEHWLDFPFFFWSTLAHSKVFHSLQHLAPIFGNTHKLAKKNWTAFCREK